MTLDILSGMSHNETNNWNCTQETVLQKKGEQSMGYKWMHNKCCTRLTKYNNLLGIVAIIFGATSGTGAFLNLAFNNMMVEIVVGMTGYLSAASSALLKFLQLDKRAEEHKEAAIKFQALGSDIVNQLAMRRNDRFSGNEYMEKIRTKFDRLIAESPSIEQIVLNEFNKKFGEKDISKPDVANGIDVVVIQNGESKTENC